MQIDIAMVQKAKEMLGDANALIITNELGIEPLDMRNPKCCCPFHAEDTPSFIYHPKTYNFHCYGACGRSYDLIDVLMSKGKTYNEACQKLFDLADLPYSFGEVGIRTKRQYRYPKEVQCTDKSKVYDYLSLRKISPKTVDYADVRQDAEGNIVFNFYDTNDVLTMVKYRPSHKVQKGETKTWCQKGADTSPLLFNMNRINPNEPLLITEGEIDCLSAIESGWINAVSVPLGAGNTNWITEHLAWLNKFQTIIICSDNDDAGLKMQKECVTRLGASRTRVVQLPPFVELPDGTKRKVSDLNEVLYFFGKEAVLRAIAEAPDTPVPGVVDFADIEDRDLDQMDGISTGLPALDKLLMKVFYGTLNIVTGINGSGKSSFLNQLICQCLDSGENAFLFSGELPNFQTRNWINFLFAGQRNVERHQSGESVYYKVSEEAKKKIGEYYRGKLFIRKDGESNKKTDVLTAMEDSIRKYGCKLVIIDNLTAMNLEGNDSNKYEKQAEFVVELINLATTYQVAVILVVHPHKMDMMRRMNKMDVQGISAIIDLAHRIISLYRVSESEKRGEKGNRHDEWRRPPVDADVIIDVLKDRITGYENGSVNVYYDRPSRRFFTTEADLDHQYAWDKREYNTPLPYPPEQLMVDEEENEVFGDGDELR